MGTRLAASLVLLATVAGCGDRPSTTPGAAGPTAGPAAGPTAAGPTAAGATAARPAPAGPFTRAKIDTARLQMKELADVAYLRWAADTPDRRCPSSLADLGAYLSRRSFDDPWGRPYAMRCGDDLGVEGVDFGIVSAGPDGAVGTADDLRSWDPVAR